MNSRRESSVESVGSRLSTFKGSRESSPNIMPPVKYRRPRGGARDMATSAVDPVSSSVLRDILSDREYKFSAKMSQPNIRNFQSIREFKQNLFNPPSNQPF